MQTVVLTEQEWQQVLGIIAQAPWNIANPLLMKIGEQLRLASGLTAPQGFRTDTPENKPGRVNG